MLAGPVPAGSHTDLRVLRRRAQSLARSPILPMWAADGDETVEELERRRAEQAFQFAVCERVWWTLNAEERDTIRSVVLQERSASPLDLPAFKAECLAEVGRLLCDEGNE